MTNQSLKLQSYVKKNYDSSPQGDTSISLQNYFFYKLPQYVCDNYHGPTSDQTVVTKTSLVNLTASIFIHYAMNTKLLPALIKAMNGSYKLASLHGLQEPITIVIQLPLAFRSLTVRVKITSVLPNSKVTLMSRDGILVQLLLLDHINSY